VAPEVLAALADCSRSEVHATGPDRVLVECYRDAPTPTALLFFAVSAAEVTTVTAYHPG
jgi:hypothetical protein